MTVGVEAIGCGVAPASGEQWRKLPGTRAQCARVVVMRVGDDEVELSSRASAGRGRIGKFKAEQLPDAGLGHETEHPARRQGELGHSWHVEPRRQAKR